MAEQGQTGVTNLDGLHVANKFIEPEFVPEIGGNTVPHGLPFTPDDILVVPLDATAVITGINVDDVNIYFTTTTTGPVSIRVC